MTRIFSYNGDRKVYLFCGIKGLMRDGEALKDELNVIEPEKIYISISQEEVEGLKKFLEDPFEINLSDYEILYGVALSRYGEVMTPPPIFIEPVSYAVKSGVPVVGLDYPEEEYSKIYTDMIGPKDLVMHSLRKKSVGRKRFPYETPEEFIVEWDRIMTKSKRMKKLEDMRSGKMMETFLQDFRNSAQRTSILIMEFEKCAMCTEFLESNGFRLSS